MASTFTTNLKFNKPALGDAGWGTAVNGGFTDLADVAISGVETVDVTAGNVTMTIDSGASGTNDARNMFIEVDGTLPANRVVTVPVSSKLYFVFNNTSGAYTLDFENVGGGVEVPQGKRVPLYSDGTEVLYAFDHLGALTLDTALAATSGGTGQSSYAVGDLLYADTTTTLAKLAAVATGSVLRAKGVGTAPAWEQVDLTTDVTDVLPPANGGTGLSDPGALNNVLSSDGAGNWTSAALSTLVPDATDSVKGVVELATDAEVQAGTDTTRAITPDAFRQGALVLGTTVPALGAAIQFVGATGIPSWAKRITILFDIVSISGTDDILVQVGDSGGYATSSYDSASSAISSAVATIRATNGFIIYARNATRTLGGRVVIEKKGTYEWVSSHVLGDYTIPTSVVGGGSMGLSGVLDRVQIILTGSNVFDSGSINIMYE